MITAVAKNRTTDRRKKNYTGPCYNIDDIHVFYKEIVKDSSKKFKVNKKIFKEVCSEYNKLLSFLIVEKSQQLKLPYKLGEIGIRKKKMNYDTKYLKFDYGTFNKTGQKVMFVNDHSNGWRARWYWKKKSCHVKYKKYYSFVPTMSNKRSLANIMKTKDGFKRYFTE
jgi:CRISPR/Cas system-associated protein endoribonuclease Cas2